MLPVPRIPPVICCESFVIVYDTSVKTLPHLRSGYTPRHGRSSCPLPRKRRHRLRHPQPPEKLNTLNEPLIQGLADALDRAAASPDARAVILRGNGRAFSAGYDLNPAQGAPRFQNPYDAPSPEPREGAWDPVRDYAFMATT
ncbi:MAG: enoyl-CoA hydratase-related protein [Dehalococcoidia bacterium]|nr:enoyl-CoA hydratase-related protein [Dehalococcoidia bacterium]